MEGAGKPSGLFRNTPSAFLNAASLRLKGGEIFRINGVASNFIFPSLLDPPAA